ncbi:MAG: nucleoside hydrolase [Saprospiraceae bacterium]|nr:nucleoside hydrolase [Saprospiraceae bacterium]
MNFTQILFIQCILIASVGMEFQSQPDPIWIDTDIGIGKLNKDVDDGIALIMALKSPKVDIRGISLVGNTDYGYKICMRLIQWYHDSPIKIPVCKGARNSDDSETENQAVRSMAEALSHEKMTIIALGPLTNISHLLIAHPELKSNIIKIIWCGGRSPNTHFKPGSGKVSVCDCNFDHDDAAAQVVINTGVPVILAGYEAAENIYLSAEDILPLKTSTYPGDQWVYQQLKSWQNLWSIFLNSKSGFIPFDAVTMGCFLYPELTLTQSQVPVHITVMKNDTPWRLFKPEKKYLLAASGLPSSHKVDFCAETLTGMKAEILKLLICPPPKQQDDHDSSFLTGIDPITIIK